MNPSKSEQDHSFFHHHFHHHHHHRRRRLRRPILHPPDQFPPSIDPPFSLLFDDDNDSSSHSDDDPQNVVIPPEKTLTLKNPTFNEGASNSAYINPKPHISSQFYTFNCESHALMIKCLIEGRVAAPVEIKAVTSPEVLRSWRSVWRDRNEDTAYVTAWKRIQDKLQQRFEPGSGNYYLCFKNNSSQFVSYVEQWQDIVMKFHGDSDLKHLGLKETIERIKQVWTVGAKFYGIPESFIRVCIASCSICSGNADGNGGGVGGGRPKRRRFEYTESFDVPAREVPNRLLQLAKKHKVVLCIRQKYIRYKPFMAEVKDYACHRAGEPVSKKSKVLKREPYASKRCGCGFRIRAIVPIANYNEKDKTFVYQEEGMAVFKLYAVHTGHEPGPLDGNARIMHRVVGHKGAFFTDLEDEYGVNEEMESDAFVGLGSDERDLRHRVLQQVQELKSEAGLLESRISKIPLELLEPVSQELYDLANKVRILGEEASKAVGLLSEKPHTDDILVGNGEMAHWTDSQRLYVDGKETDLIEEDEDRFAGTFGDVAPWHQMREECRSQKDMLSDFDEKSILECEDSKLTKSIRHDDHIDTDVGLVGIQVDGFYSENPKWYDSPCGLDSSTDCGDSGF